AIYTDCDDCLDIVLRWNGTTGDSTVCIRATSSMVRLHQSTHAALCGGDVRRRIHRAASAFSLVRSRIHLGRGARVPTCLGPNGALKEMDEKNALVRSRSGRATPALVVSAGVHAGAAAL